MRDGANNRQIGGDGSALMYVIPNALVGVSTSFVASVNLDGANATVRLFINDTFIGAATGRIATDWAGTNGGGFFDRTDDVLAANFGTNTFNGPTGAEATADSSLRVYEDLDVVAAGHLVKDAPVTFSFAPNVSDSNTAFGSGNYANNDNFLATGSGPQLLTDNLSAYNLNLTVEDGNGSNLNINSLGAGSSFGGNASWSAGDIIDLTYDQTVTLDTLWFNHGDINGSRTMEVHAVIALGTVDEVDLGIISITNDKNTTPYAMYFGHEIADNIIIDVGTVLRLIQPGLSGDATRITGITVNVVPAPAALPAGLVLLAAAAMRRRGSICPTRLSCVVRTKL